MSAPRPLLGSRSRLAKVQKQNAGEDPTNKQSKQRGQDKKNDSLPSPSAPPVPPELVATQDELDWLLDGLPSPSSFQELLDLLFSNAGRALVAKRPITAQSIVDRLSSLEDVYYEDLSTCRAVSCVLLILTLCGKISIFTSGTTILLVKRIVVANGVRNNEAAVKSNNMKNSINLVRLLSDQNVCRFVPREVSASPWCVCLACLAYCVEPRDNYDPSKIKASISPLLDLLVSTVVEESGALNDPNPTLKTVVALWKLKTTLSILEQACFACERNQQILNEKQLETGCPPLEKIVGFNQFLVGLIRTLASHNRRLPSEGIKKDCFLLLISVLMNTTEGDAGACRDIQPEHLSRCICKLWSDTEERRMSHTDELSALLGVLINVVDEVGCDSICSDREALSQLVIVLCAMTKATGDDAEGCRHNGHGRVDVDQVDLDDGSVTVESLDRRDARQSSAEAYGSILLGFLLVGSAEVRHEVQETLGQAGVDRVRASIERTLAFYLRVDALTQKTKERLSALITSLSSLVAV